jgi:hypothetical protein
LRKAEGPVTIIQDDRAYNIQLCHVPIFSFATLARKWLRSMGKGIPEVRGKQLARCMVRRPKREKLQ